MGNSFDLSDRFTGDLDFILEYNLQENRFGLRFNGGDTEGVSAEFLSEMQRAVTDQYFQRYAINLLGKRRRNPRLDLNVSFKSGKVNPRNTFVQATTLK